ncbi:allatostatin-A receptor [Eurytemora carolleeae]|uniref:allatostatin-A receptor n=1 Tax=Eurytemora carolleeae TaxID=1294199 RepID=UPI000C77E225|nr:allatostatin-A receptor [Eurytemora carolleeae]|eukprot:XP_023348763.1 allatostatin-A receptor-like [Eurytemora affinis]
MSEMMGDLTLEDFPVENDGNKTFIQASAASATYNMTGLEEEDIRRLTLFLVPVAFGIILTVGLVGNILVIAVVATNPQMRNTTNLLILNLAVADLLFLIMCVPFTAVDYVLMSWPFGLVWCRTVQYLIYVTAYVSIYTLVLMAGDRFLAVVFPVSSLSIRTMQHAKVAIASTWVIIFLVSLPVWFSHNILSHNGVDFCQFDSLQHSYFGFHVGFFVTSFALPVVLILIMYIIMLSRLWASTTYRISKQGLKAKKRVTKLVFAVVIAFTVCWSPIQVVLVLKSLNNQDWDTQYNKIVIQIVSHVMAYTNSCLNPILYAMMSKNFRCGFCQVKK